MNTFIVLQRKDSFEVGESYSSEYHWQSWSYCHLLVNPQNVQRSLNWTWVVRVSVCKRPIKLQLWLVCSSRDIQAHRVVMNACEGRSATSLPSLMTLTTASHTVQRTFLVNLWCDQITSYTWWKRILLVSQLLVQNPRYSSVVDHLTDRQPGQNLLPGCVIHSSIQSMAKLLLTNPSNHDWWVKSRKPISNLRIIIKSNRRTNLALGVNPQGSLVIGTSM